MKVNIDGRFRVQCCDLNADNGSKREKFWLPQNGYLPPGYEFVCFGHLNFDGIITLYVRGNNEKRTTKAKHDPSLQKMRRTRKRTLRPSPMGADAKSKSGSTGNPPRRRTGRRPAPAARSEGQGSGGTK